jgi:glycosyltransferase involved in cell wall biosynthesis
MKIAVNTRFLLPNKMEGFGWYTYEITKRLVENNPNHEFIFFFDRPYDSKFIFASNVTPVVLSPPARHPILFYIWFEFAVKKALRRYKADVFFSPDGYLSLASDVKQIAVIHDLNFEHFPKDIPWTPRVYLRHFFPKFARKATKIITVSNYSKQDICKTYNIPEEKITAIWNAASPVFSVLEDIEKNKIKEEFAQNAEYFLFVGAIHPRKNVGRLIQAYSNYLKQGGTKKLLIVGENLWKNNAKFSIQVESNIAENIIFTGHLSLEKLAAVMASAFCFVFVPYFEGFGIPLVEAMQSGVPIIAGNRTSLPEVVGDAAILVNPFSPEEICNALFEIEANAQLRNELIQKGLERSRLFSWDEAAKKVWEVILSVDEKN